MKTQLLTLAAVFALGAGTANAALPTAPDAAIGPDVSADTGVEQVGYFWRYREFWRGNCKYKTIYVTNGYRWAYRYRYRCF